MSTAYERTVRVPKEQRTVYVERKSDSYDRTVYVTE